MSLGPAAWARPARCWYRSLVTAANDTIFALSSGRPPAAIAVVRVSGPRARAALEALIGRVPEPRKAALRGRARPGVGRADRPGAGAVVSRAAQRDRRGRRRASAPRRPRRHRRRAGRARPDRRSADGGAGRVHPPRLRARPARPHPGRGARRPDRRRDRGAAPAGVPADARPARRPRRGLAARAPSRRWRRSKPRIDFADEGDVPKDLHRPRARDRSAAGRRDRRGARRRRRAASGCARDCGW